MKDLIFALISSNSTKTKQASSKLRELTIAWSRYGYHGEFIEEATIDKVLQKASQTNHRYCLIQTAGHVIDEQWFLSHWIAKGFYQGLSQLQKKGDFLVVGEWFISENGCAGFKKDCLLIDLACYRKVGKPVFGDADQQIRELQLCYSDSNAASLIQYSSQKEHRVSDCEGWNFVQIGYTHQLKISKFSKSINNCRFDLTNNNNQDQFIQLIGKPVEQIDHATQLTLAQETFIRRIRKQLEHAKKGVFLFNIESYHDLIPDKKKQPLDALFSVAAGFKPYRILHSQGYHQETQVVLFDYSLKALEVRQFMIENWDGIDFVSFIKKLFKRFAQPEVFYQLWYGVTPETLDWDDMEHLWQQELLKWGGAEAFSSHWQQCQKLPHKYIHCDLLKNRQQLLSELSQYQNSYIWWSNAFFTIFSHWFYTASERKSHYINWIQALVKVNPECQINGADHNNIAVNGLTAEKYIDQFNYQHNDELTPQNLHSVEIQF